MARQPTELARRLSGYFIGHLAGARGLSENTIDSRRTTFTLLFEYCREREGLPTATLDVPDLDRPLVERFLAWAERERGNSVSTRNLRLDAIKAFFSWLQTVAPEHMLQCQQIAAIPRKRAPRAQVRWLTLDEVQSLLGGIDSSTWRGLRDLALLTLLYDSGARVSEIAGARVPDLRLEAPATIRLVGKGMKERHVPLMDGTVRVLRAYLERGAERGVRRNEGHLFVNRSGNGLTRGGISHVLQRHWEPVFASGKSPVERVTPHVLRHSKAVHLLQAGVPLIYIRDFLGHSQISTTEVYATCDHASIRKAIEESGGVEVDVSEPEWERDPDLLRWLESLSG